MEYLKCDGCGKPATCSDSKGVSLCEYCAQSLLEEEPCTVNAPVMHMDLIIGLETMKNKYMNKRVNFISGNFAGKSGICIDVKNKYDAIYGKQLTFRLDDGRLVYAQKSEHFKIV